ncbi:MAG TPA: hypothetical protein VNO34_07925 [Actinomycetota bacterium]|nr:hypothetical protein [Actinomycetota bacterium]
MGTVKAYDPEDPFEIVGVLLDGPMDDAAVEEMARTFVEEYVLQGWTARRILAMFHNPFFAGAHEALHRLGEERLQAIVREVAGAESTATEEGRARA